MRTERTPPHHAPLLAGLAGFLLLASAPSAVHAQEGDGESTVDPVTLPGDVDVGTYEDDEELSDRPPEPPAPVVDAPRATEEAIETRVTYTIVDGFFVDVEPGTTLRTGRRGWLEIDGRRIVPIEVGQVSSNSAFIRVTPTEPPRLPATGDVVRLLLEPLSAPRVRDEDPTTLKPDRDAPDPEFEPLLGPYVIDAETRNLLHGRFGVRQTFQATSNGLEDAYRTIIDTAGSWDRLGGTPWSLEWSMDAIYRDGAALSADDHYQEVYPEVRRLSLVRRYDDRSITRVGRFLPAELPAVGTLDGFQSEIVLGPYLRIGGMLGLKPDRGDLAPTADEPTVVSYTTFYWEEDRDAIYSATAGFLISRYEGDTDRLAVLLDQHARFGRWSFFSTGELDLDSGAAIATDGARLTRLDVSGTYRLGGTILRAGVNRFGIPDTAAERDQLTTITTDASAFFEDDQWRTSVGATHALSATWTLEEEVSFIDSETTDDQLLWLVGLSKQDFLVRGSNLSARIYQLGGEDLDGVGGSITGYFPLRDGRLALMPSISGRVSRTDEPDMNLEVGDIGLRMLWRFTDRCTLNCGGAYTSSDDIDRARFDVGITIRW